MEFITLFFLALSIFVIGYIGLVLKSSIRIPIFVEVFFIGIYVVVFLLVLFPSLLRFIESSLGISSAIDFIVYLSIFVLFFMVFLLYRKSEKQRVEISKLVREISYLRKK